MFRYLTILSFFLTVIFSNNSYTQWSTPIPIDSTRYRYPIGGQIAVDDSDNIYTTFNSSEGNKLFVARSTDGGSTWMQYAYAGAELSRVPRDIVVDHLGNIWLLWISWQDEFSLATLNLSKSTDHGQTFNTFFSSLAYADGGLFQKLAVDRQNSIYMLWDDFKFKLTRFRYGDVNQRFDAEVPNDTFKIDSHPAFVVSKDFVVHCTWEGVLYETTGFHYYIFNSRSVDTGLTFQGKTLVDSAMDPDISVTSAGTIIVVDTRFRIVQGALIGSLFISRSTDKGESFTAPTLISATDTVYWSRLAIDSQDGVNLLWISQNGLQHYRSLDGAKSFSLFAVNQVGLIDVEANRNGFLCGTSSNDSGITFTKIDVILSVAGNSYKPSVFKLFPNYPNPFNPSTTIQFSVAAYTFVELSIFDVLGCKAEVLFSKYASPGSYSVTWDASRYSSGVYFARLEAGNKYVAIEKIVYMK